MVSFCASARLRMVSKEPEAMYDVESYHSVVFPVPGGPCRRISRFQFSVVRSSRGFLDMVTRLVQTIVRRVFSLQLHTHASQKTKKPG